VRTLPRGGFRFLLLQLQYLQIELVDTDLGVGCYLLCFGFKKRNFSGGDLESLPLLG
jgi:hypothetical protein